MAVRFCSECPAIVHAYETTCEYCTAGHSWWGRVFRFFGAIEHRLYQYQPA